MTPHLQFHDGASNLISRSGVAAYRRAQAPVQNVPFTSYHHHLPCLSPSPPSPSSPSQPLPPGHSRTPRPISPRTPLITASRASPERTGVVPRRVRRPTVKMRTVSYNFFFSIGGCKCILDGIHSHTDLPCPTVNAVDDFCLWAPPEPGAGSVIGNTEGRISSMTVYKSTLTGLPTHSA